MMKLNSPTISASVTILSNFVIEEGEKMKTKHIPTLLFILAFAAVALTGYPPAQADWDRTCTSSPDGACVTAGNWTVAAYVDGVTDVVLGETWPIRDVAHNRVIFRYITGITNPGTKVSAQSYMVFNWPELPLGANPPGAQLALDQLFKDCGSEPETGIAYKLNRVATDKKDGIIDIYMPLDTCVNTKGAGVWIKPHDECHSGAPLWVALGSGEVGTIYPEIKEYYACNTHVTVTFDRCYGFPTSVTDADGNPCTYKPDAILCIDKNNDGITTDDECETTPNIGPRIGGALLCTDGPPVFVYGDGMWFCQ